MLVKTLEEKNIFANSHLKVILGVVLIALMAQINIPIKPVSITLQTVAVILIALVYSPSEAFKTMFLYTLLGLLGVPVFMHYTSGIEKLYGPSAGYIIGMFLAAPIVSYVKMKFYFDIAVPKQSLVLILFAQAIIYLFGVSWLSYLIGFDKAVYGGFLVFVPSGIVKSLLLCLFSRYLCKK